MLKIRTFKIFNRVSSNQGTFVGLGLQIYPPLGEKLWKD